MEKSGKRQYGKPSGRLLNRLKAAVALLFAAPALSALSVGIDVSGAEVEPGNEVVLTVTAYNAALGDTTFDYGTLPEGFTLSSSKKESARLNPPEGLGSVAVPSVIFTLVLRARERGVWNIGPLIVKSGTEGFNGDAVTLTVPGDPLGANPDTAIRWALKGSGTLRTGSERTLALLGPPAAVGADISCPAPENALLEPLGTPLDAAVSPETGLSVLALFRWTPLAAGEIQLPTATVSGLPGGRSLSSEAASLRVYPAALTASPESVSPGLISAFTEVPEADSGKADTLPAAASEDLAAELASLRSAEYRSFFPGKLRAKRLALEREAGLGETLPVPPAAWKLPAVLGSVSVLALALFFSLLSSRFRLFGGAGLAAGFLSAALAFFAVSLYIRDNHPAGVASSGPLYNVPEYGSRALETISGGTALFALRNAGGWVYAENADGARGWIPEERFHPYTAETGGTE